MKYINGYKFNNIAEINNAILTINNANNFIPIDGNVTQTLVVASQHTYGGQSFFVIRFDEYSQLLGTPIEINVD
jgi:hypothetical protein